MKVKLVNEPIKNNYGANLLRARGVGDVDLFLHPTSQCLQSFEALDNYQLGVKAIEKTLHDLKPYAIIMDCDCDGVCSGAIFYQYIKRLNPEKEIRFFIHQGKQHGFSDLIEELNEVDWSLIICPDAGRIAA